MSTSVIQSVEWLQGISKSRYGYYKLLFITASVTVNSIGNINYINTSTLSLLIIIKATPKQPTLEENAFLIPSKAELVFLALPRHSLTLLSHSKVHKANYKSSSSERHSFLLI